MDEFNPVVRIQKRDIQKHVHKTVALVGKIVSSNPECTQIQASDGGIVEVLPSSGSDHSNVGSCIEIIGKINDQFQIQEFQCTQYGDTFDLSNYDKLITLSSTTYRDLFV